MLSHPLTFLIGYLIATFIVSFLVVGPLGVFISMLFRRRIEKRYTQGIYVGISMTLFVFLCSSIIRSTSAAMPLPIGPPC